MFCRACYATREELRGGKFGQVFETRTVESVRQPLGAVKRGTIAAKVEREN